MSFRKKHIKSRIQHSRPKKLFFQRLWFWLLVLMLLIAAGIVYFFFFYQALQVKDAVISGNQQIPKQALQQTIQPTLNNAARHILGIPIPARNMLLFPAAAISQEILRDFPTIEQVTVKKQFPQTLDVTVEERTPAAIYCSDNCFIVDPNGVAYQAAPSDASSYVIVRQSDTAGSAELGQQVVSSDRMTEALAIGKQTRDAMGITVTEIHFQPDQITATTSEGWQVYFGTDGESSLSDELVQLKALLNGTISLDSRKQLHYIDLRFTNRAYYQ